MLFVVSAFPREEWARAEAIVAELRRRFVDRPVVGLLPEEDSALAADTLDRVAYSFEDAVAQAREVFPAGIAGGRRKKVPVAATAD